MPESVIQRSFAGGELAPALHARADQVKYATGLRRCRNMLVLRSGGVANRPGLRFIAPAKTDSDDVKLLRYISEFPGQSVLIEHGIGYFRFFQGGAAVEVSGVAPWDGSDAYIPGDLVEDGGVNYYSKTTNTNQEPSSNPDDWYALTGDIYEVPSPSAVNLFNWVQSSRVITLTHADEAPYELVFETLTRWIIRPIVTEPGIDAPANLVITPGDASGLLNFSYIVTAAAADTYEESNPSTAQNSNGIGEPTEDAPNEVTWDAVAGAGEYYVYADPYGNGVHGFIGTAVTNSFNDIGFTPDFSRTPPVPRSLFASVNNYPNIAAYHQQRRFFAYTNNEPDAVWASRPGFPSNFGISSPLQDDDALTFRIAGNNNHPVRHLVPLKQLIAMTDGGAWPIGRPKEALTPTDIPAEQETYVGSHDKPPCIVGNRMIYIEARGSLLRDLRFDQEVEGLAGRDLTLFASHLFDGRSVGSIDYAHTPHSTVWATHGGGSLLGLTYIPEQEVWGWHRHDSGANAVFNQVIVVPEPAEDAVYGLVQRTIDGAQKMYIERLASRLIGEDTFDEDAFFVDSGLSYSGAPADEFSGLDHLEGQVVAVLADGAVIFDGDASAPNAGDFTVTAGVIALGAFYNNVHIGLPIRFGEIETLDLDTSGADIRDKQKKVVGVTLLIDRSSRSFKVGPDATHLVTETLRPWETVADEHTGAFEITVQSSFEHPGRVFIRQTDPLPLTILGVIPNLELGG